MRENELRLEFLGGSTHWTLLSIQIYAGALAGLAGTLTAITALHVDPDFAYWTNSGEFVFIVVLGGVLHVMAPFLSAFFLETVRMIATSAFPDYWQFVIGAMMLATVIFFPNGLWTVPAGVRRRLSALRRDPTGAGPETGGMSDRGST